MQIAENYDYTYSISDNLDSRQLQFRDITGNDLEFIEYLFDSKSSIDSTDFCELIIKRFCLNIGNDGFISLPLKFLRDCVKVYIDSVINKHFISKLDWLEILFYLNNQSFSGFDKYENMPMEKFLAMKRILIKHNERLNQQRTSR